MAETNSIPCPKCKAPLEPASWHSTVRGGCRRCLTQFEFTPFPAWHAVRSVARAQQAEVAADAVCFYHPTNQAELACPDCGRLVCSICAIDYDGARICPSCVAVRRKDNAKAVNSRVLWDGIALALATFPLLLWPFTLVTAPAALTIAIIGWRKPGSLVRRTRLRLIVAGILAALQIVGWIAGFSGVLESLFSGPL